MTKSGADADGERTEERTSGILEQEAEGAIDSMERSDFILVFPRRRRINHPQIPSKTLK
jgi:hypothetical protein